MRLVPVDAANRGAVAALTVAPEQSRVRRRPDPLPGPVRRRGPLAPLAVCDEDTVVGFLLWAIDEEDASCWLGGIIIDAWHQGAGSGGPPSPPRSTSWPTERPAVGSPSRTGPTTIGPRPSTAAWGSSRGEQVDGALVARLGR
ncbi:MAG TPA: hypothetical protein PLA44_11185 [Propionibacteriaceae bacterium]|nr:hypothetical protein [Propionibacteriaceae bacterium]